MDVATIFFLVLKHRFDVLKNEEDGQMLFSSARKIREEEKEILTQEELKIREGGYFPTCDRTGWYK